MFGSYTLDRQPNHSLIVNREVQTAAFVREVGKEALMHTARKSLLKPSI
jgi:hypothetical protein